MSSLTLNNLFLSAISNNQKLNYFLTLTFDQYIFLLLWYNTYIGHWKFQQQPIKKTKICVVCRITNPIRNKCCWVFFYSVLLLSVALTFFLNQTNCEFFKYKKNKTQIPIKRDRDRCRFSTHLVFQYRSSAAICINILLSQWIAVNLSLGSFLIIFWNDHSWKSKIGSESRELNQKPT